MGQHRRVRRRGETCAWLPSFVVPRPSDTVHCPCRVRSPVSSQGMKAGPLSPVKPFPGSVHDSCVQCCRYHLLLCCADMPSFGIHHGNPPPVSTPPANPGTSPHALIMSPRPSASGSLRASPATPLTPRDPGAGASRQSEKEMTEKWRFSPFEPPLANGAAEADSSAEAADFPAQRAAQKMWQQRALRAAEQVRYVFHAGAC